MKYILVFLFVGAVIFYGIGFGFGVKCSFSEDIKDKRISNCFTTVGMGIFAIFLILLILHGILKFL